QPRERRRNVVRPLWDFPRARDLAGPTTRTRPPLHRGNRKAATVSNRMSFAPASRLRLALVVRWRIARGKRLVARLVDNVPRRRWPPHLLRAGRTEAAAARARLRAPRSGADRRASVGTRPASYFGESDLPAPWPLVWGIWLESGPEFAPLPVVPAPWSG